MHFKLKGIIAIASSAVVVSAAFATVVAVNLGGYLGRIQPIPLTAKDAFGKCVAEGDGLAINKAMQSLGKELEKLLEESAVPYGMDDMKSLQEQYGSEESQAAIESMTMEQKMALGMKMQQQMGLSTQPGDMQQNQFMVELTKCNAEMADFDRTQKIDERWNAVEIKYSPLHDAVSEDTDKAVKSCPVITVGESSDPDPACIKAKRLAGADRHIALADRALKEYGPIWADYTGKLKQLIARVDSLMAKVQYGAKITGGGNKNFYGNLQSQVLGKLTAHHARTSAAITESAKWILEKKRIQERN